MPERAGSSPAGIPQQGGPEPAALPVKVHRELTEQQQRHRIGRIASERPGQCDPSRGAG